MPPHRTTAESNRVDVELVRQQYPIVDVVGRYGFELRRSGAAFIGRCPFHLDRGRPNLTVYPRSGRWVCFRCGASGDVINFVQQLEHLTFLEAVAHLGFAPPTRPIGPTRRLAQRRPERSRPLEQSEKDVLAAVDAWKQAALQGDAVTLGKLYHDDLAYTHSNAMTQNKAVAVASETRSLTA